MIAKQFPATYSADIIESIPPGSQVLNFAQSGTRSAEPVLVEITPHDGNSWVGAFARGHDEEASETGVWLTPDANRVAVVAAGAGYCLDVRNPAEWQEVPVFPVRIVLPLLEQQLLLFGDFARLAAYDSTGLRWETSNVVWDDLKVTSIGADSITGAGYDAEHDRRVEVSIALDSGEVAGAVRPPSGQARRRSADSSAEESDSNLLD